MKSTPQPVVLCVDDEPEALKLLEEWLSRSGLGVTAMSASDGPAALRSVAKTTPDLILLDILMPGMDGYAVCARLRKHANTALIPVVFATALSDEQNRARAFSLGAVDYLVKPFSHEAFVQTVRVHLETSARWKRLHEDAVSWSRRIRPSDLQQFKEFLARRLSLAPEVRLTLSRTSSAKLYARTTALGIDERVVAQAIAIFLNLPYVSRFSPDEIRLGVLPPSFARTYQVVPVKDVSSPNAFVLSNPFNWDLLDTLRQVSSSDHPIKLAFTEPETIARLLQGDTSPPPSKLQAGSPLEPSLSPEDQDRLIMMENVDTIMDMAVANRASQISIEAHDASLLIRFRAGGAWTAQHTIPTTIPSKTLAWLKEEDGLDTVQKRWLQLRLTCAGISMPAGQKSVIIEVN